MGVHVYQRKIFQDILALVLILTNQVNGIRMVITCMLYWGVPHEILRNAAVMGIAVT